MRIICSKDRSACFVLYPQQACEQHQSWRSCGWQESNRLRFCHSNFGWSSAASRLVWKDHCKHCGWKRGRGLLLLDLDSHHQRASPFHESLTWRAVAMQSPSRCASAFHRKASSCAVRDRSRWFWVSCARTRCSGCSFVWALGRPSNMSEPRPLACLL